MNENIQAKIRKKSKRPTLQSKKAVETSSNHLDQQFSVEKPKKNGVLHDGEFYPVKDCAK